MENKQNIVDIPYYKNIDFIKKCTEYAKKEIELLEMKKKYKNIIMKEFLKKINQQMTKSNTYSNELNVFKN
tara:strand:- start:259 stop:471 length:213 start_codon:yes stop_codon:yes gene_type:complete